LKSLDFFFLSLLVPLLGSLFLPALKLYRRFSFSSSMRRLLLERPKFRLGFSGMLSYFYFLAFLPLALCVAVKVVL